jgi:hypothetical protein
MWATLPGMNRTPTHGRAARRACPRDAAARTRWRTATWPARKKGPPPPGRRAASAMKPAARPCPVSSAQRPPEARPPASGHGGPGSSARRSAPSPWQGSALFPVKRRRSMPSMAGPAWRPCGARGPAGCGAAGRGPRCIAVTASQRFSPLGPPHVAPWRAGPPLRRHCSPVQGWGVPEAGRPPHRVRRGARPSAPGAPRGGPTGAPNTARAPRLLPWRDTVEGYVPVSKMWGFGTE